MGIGDRPKRRLTLLDVMILVAATAIALALARATVSPVQPDGEAIVVAWAFLTPLSWAVLLLRLKRPRPGLRRLTSRPGDAACLVTRSPQS